MRRISLLIILIVALVFASGCTNTAPAPATPLPTPPSLVTPLKPAGTAEQKPTDVTAWKTDTSVIVQYNGGSNAANLVALKVQIDNQNGQVVKRDFLSPAIGQQYEFPYQGMVDVRTVNVIATYRDGTQQTVLMQYF